MNLIPKLIIHTLEITSVVTTDLPVPVAVGGSNHWKINNKAILKKRFLQFCEKLFIFINYNMESCHFKVWRRIRNLIILRQSQEFCITIKV